MGSRHRVRDGAVRRSARRGHPHARAEGRCGLLPAANGAVEFLNEVSESKITGEEERYSHTDLVDFQANVDGARQAFLLLRPVLDERDAALARTVSARFGRVTAALAPYRRRAGFVDYSTVDAAHRRRLSQVVDALAEPLSRVGGTIVQR